MRESVVLPAPEGEDRTSISPRRLISANPLCCSTLTAKAPLFDVLDLLAKLLDGHLEVDAQTRQLDVGRLGTKRIRLAIQLLAEKVELAADGSAGVDQRLHCADMRGQPVKFLADIRLGGKQGRFLGQTFRAGQGKLIKQILELGAQTFRDGLWLSLRDASRRLGQALDFVDMALRHGNKPSALRQAHGLQAIQRFVQSL